MPDRQLPLFIILGKVVAIVLYGVAFGNKFWVHTEDFTWGLWTGCNTSDTGQNPNVTDHDNCSTFRPFGGPFYFETIRTLACITLVLYIVQVFALDPNNGPGAGNNPTTIAFLASVLVTTILLIFHFNYKKDERWGEAGTRGWCYWELVATDVYTVLLAIVLWQHKMRRSATETPQPSDPAALANPPENRANDQPLPTRSQPAEQRAPIRSFVSEAPVKNQRHKKSDDRPPRQAVQDGGSRGGGEFPLLQLQQHEPPCTWPSVPPPSYNEVMMDYDRYQHEP